MTKTSKPRKSAGRPAPLARVITLRPDPERDAYLADRAAADREAIDAAERPCGCMVAWFECPRCEERLAPPWPGGAA